MTDIDRINNNYQQRGNICVLASYWIALSYFSDNNIGTLHDLASKLQTDRLIQYDINPNSQILEDNIGNSFNSYCRNTRPNIRGYQFIYEIHKKYFNNICSIKDRAWKNGDNPNFHLSRKKIKTISNILKKKEALALLTYSTTNGFHSIVVGYSSSRGFFIRDTNSPTIQPINSLSQISSSRILEVIVFGNIDLKFNQN